MTQWHNRTLTLLVDIGHEAVVGVKQDLCVVLEVDLDNFVAESEHNSMPSSHPLFDVNGPCRRLQRTFQVVETMLQFCMLMRGTLLRCA